jgi:hypothetical protein
MASNKSNFLTEYCDVTRELEKIRNKVVILRDVAETQMTNTKSEQSKQKIFDQFQKNLEAIQLDNNTKQKYKKLKNRQAILEDHIMQLYNKDEHTQNSTIQHSSNHEIFEDLELFTEESNIRTEFINIGISTLINKYKSTINEKIVLTGLGEYQYTKKNIFDKKKNKISKLSEHDTKLNESKTQKIERLSSLIDNLKMDINY